MSTFLKNALQLHQRALQLRRGHDDVPGVAESMLELAARAADVSTENTFGFLGVTIAQGRDDEVMLLVGDPAGVGSPR